MLDLYNLYTHIMYVPNPEATTWAYYGVAS